MTPTTDLITDTTDPDWRQYSDRDAHQAGVEAGAAERHRPHHLVLKRVPAYTRRVHDRVSLHRPPEPAGPSQLKRGT